MTQCFCCLGFSVLVRSVLVRILNRTNSTVSIEVGSTVALEAKEKGGIDADMLIISKFASTSFHSKLKH